MADISMCLNLECPKHLFCARFRAVPNKHRWQTYGDFKPDAKGVCESEYPLKDYDGRVRSLEEVSRDIAQGDLDFTGATTPRSQR